MVTEVRERSNNTLWIVLAIVAVIAIVAIAFMAMNGTDDDVDVEIPPAASMPATTIIDAGSAAADSAAAAARSAQDAAANAADSAGAAARNAADATADAANRITVPGPGDSTITVTSPPAR